jgi:hypothetical protein
MGRQEGLVKVWGCTECDFEVPTGDALLATGLSLLLAASYQAEAGRRAC